MPLKKSELYSSLWASCDELRGGMDASQYKDYVLVLLFIKYISDKYSGQPYSAIKVPKGATFADMVQLRGKPDIGEKINTKIVGPLVKANPQLSQSDFADFDDPTKLGSGKEMVDRLTNLVAIFERPELDFSKNRAEGDDLLGDAYEYLMRNFATESGKSKGQFYTPAEVSRTIAQLLDIRQAHTRNDTSVYDPTCGSGSLLIKIGDEAAHDKDVRVTLYGQEKDSATAGLARMNMILHNYPTAEIKQGNTLTSPEFKDGDKLKTFDYVVANPPFSDKRWSTGLDPDDDPYDRFKDYGAPPNKQGDYAYLLHIIRSIKPNGRGACILPHGVLFRGNSEAAIRKNLIERGYIKGIIGLPPNLFYGTGIPACIVVIDKKDAGARKGIFMIDASKGFLKDGNKNRLREQDIHRIVDTFSRQVEIARYSRMVPVTEISDPKNDYNLNLPRYIDSSEPEDIQDIDAHLRGGIPNRDIDALERYWKVAPGVREALFRENVRPGYSELKVPIAEIKATIFNHPEFTAFKESVGRLFRKWTTENIPLMKGFAKGGKPKVLIETFSENLLAAFGRAPLLDPYDLYQHLMDYWKEIMQDDCYFLSIEGWKARPEPVKIKDKKTCKEKDKGWACDLVPKDLPVAHYFKAEKEEIENMSAELESISAKLTEIEEENGGDEGIFGDFEKINKVAVSNKLTELWEESAQTTMPLKKVAEPVVPFDDGSASDEQLLRTWLSLNEQQTELKKKLKQAETDLDAKALAKYSKLTIEEIKTLVVDEKWHAALRASVEGEVERVSQALTFRIRQLAERYVSTLPELTDKTDSLSQQVTSHLKRLDSNWN